MFNSSIEKLEFTCNSCNFLFLKFLIFFFLDDSEVKLNSTKEVSNFLKENKTITNLSVTNLEFLNQDYEFFIESMELNTSLMEFSVFGVFEFEPRIHLILNRNQKLHSSKDSHLKKIQKIKLFDCNFKF